MSKQIATQKPFPPIVSSFGYSPLQPAIWRNDPESKLQYRNLSLDQASEDVLVGKHYRSAGIHVSTVFIADPTACFSFIFVLAGKLNANIKGQNVTLTALDSACRYGSGREVQWTLSHDAELVEISALPAAHAALGFDEASLGEWQFSRDEESNYTLGQGPRRYFKYHDLGVAACNKSSHSYPRGPCNPENGGRYRVALSQHGSALLRSAWLGGHVGPTPTLGSHVCRRCHVCRATHGARCA
ncbi:hypothetical protein LP415_13950 [Polaromonas sp. P1(28)-8]|nr:hypothetical protein LP415_13950 [Polaromonas sp. P1(28)-8]